ncbi:MAG: LysE family translocator [Phormidesmis sp.]
MNSETVVALGLFSIATSITPGPNNIMLLASGVNFGFRRTLPHTLGISVGFCILLLSVGLGLGTLFTTVPGLHLALKVLGSLYMLYLAFQIASSRKLSNKLSRKPTQANPQKAHKPMTFLAAALFQWVNPKAWVMAVSSMALYTNATRPYLSVLMVAAIFSSLNWPSCSTWAICGQALKRFLSDSTRLKWFNIAMGTLLAASVVLIIK